MSVDSVSEAVIWHDVECGAYEADLPLWSALASEVGGRVLDLGCGTGRVALHLARGGSRVTAIDREVDLIAELGRRAADAGLDVDAKVADASRLALDDEFDLIIAPMQLVQLLDRDGRRRCLKSVSGHLRPGGRAAFAIVEGVETGTAESPPLPDVREIESWIYSSMPLGVRVDDDCLVVERLRQTVARDGRLTDSRSEDRLRVLDASLLEAEACDSGLKPSERLAIDPSSAHVGSTVVVLERS
jgi:SAM-dependent methyltransferase